MSFQRLLTQHPSEAMHVQGNDGQSNRSGKSLSTFRPNTVEATVFKIVDGRLHSGVLTAHSSEGFTLFAFPISLAEAALLGPAGPKLRNRSNFRTYHEQRLYSERFSLKFRCKLRGGGYFDGEYWP